MANVISVPLAHPRTHSPIDAYTLFYRGKDRDYSQHIERETKMIVRRTLRILIAWTSIAAPMTVFSVSNVNAKGTEVGFEQRQMDDGTKVGIWYPASGSAQRKRLGLYEQDVVPDAAVLGARHGLVVISHGSGGHFAGHLDTAIALARAGFIVAALTHSGDNWQDRSKATQLERRPQDLSAVVTYMLDVWPSHTRIDVKKIGAFGFSAGGFTVLAAVGARPDFTTIAPHCTAHPAFFDCTLMRQNPQNERPLWTDKKDARIKAIVVAAPALGFTFTKAALAPVTLPVQLWRAANDQVLPAPLYADAVKAALPKPPEYYDVAGAGHFDFLAPCVDPKQNPQICSSDAAFDRAAFHTLFNQNIVRFFRRHLRK